MSLEGGGSVLPGPIRAVGWSMSMTKRRFRRNPKLRKLRGIINLVTVIVKLLSSIVTLVKVITSFNVQVS